MSEESTTPDFVERNVRWRYAAVSLWVDNAVSRETNYTDTDEARAAAKRLAQERG